MKNLKYLFLALILCMPIFVNAANLDVDTVADLDACLAIDGNTCTLESDITFSATDKAILLSDNQNVVIDLNSHNITGDAAQSELFEISNATLEIKGSGTITAENDAFYLQGNEVVGGAAIPANLTIGKDVKVISKTSNCVYLRGKGAKLDVYGKLESRGDFSVIQGNGTKNDTKDAGNTVITIYDGAEVINTYGYVDSNTLVNPAIYHPQSGTLTVKGGKIEGVSGIEMRSGTLVVEGGTIIATAPETTSKNNGNGPALMGVGIGVAQHTTIQEVSITINNGTVKGATAVYEATPENPHDENIVELQINGGEFVATKDGGDAVFSENKENFITDGKFTGEIADEYAKDEFALVEDENGNKIVLDGTKIIELVKKMEELLETEEKAKQYTEESLKTLLAVVEEMRNINVNSIKSQAELDAIAAKLEKAINGLETHEEAKKRLEEEAKNPDTADNILIYIAVASIALVGLTTTVVLNKRYN